MALAAEAQLDEVHLLCLKGAWNKVKTPKFRFGTRWPTDPKRVGQTLKPLYVQLGDAFKHLQYRGTDNSLSRPGRKDVNVSVRMAWISFGALPCRKKNLMTARVSMLLNSRASLTWFRACFLLARAKDLSAQFDTNTHIQFDTQTHTKNSKHTHIHTHTYTHTPTHTHT